MTFFFLCVCILYVRGEERKMQKLEIVPAPENFTLEKGNFIFKASTVITVEDTAMVSVAEQFASLFNVPAGFTPQVKTTAKAGDVCLRFDSSLKKKLIAWSSLLSGLTCIHRVKKGRSMPFKACANFCLQSWREESVQ